MEKALNGHKPKNKEYEIHDTVVSVYHYELITMSVLPGNQDVLAFATWGSIRYTSLFN